MTRRSVSGQAGVPVPVPAADVWGHSDRYASTRAQVAAERRAGYDTGAGAAATVAPAPGAGGPGEPGGGVDLAGVAPHVAVAVRALLAAAPDLGVHAADVVVTLVTAGARVTAETAEVVAALVADPHSHGAPAGGVRAAMTVLDAGVGLLNRVELAGEDDRVLLGRRGRVAAPR
jgi:hypothetical protein